MQEKPLRMVFQRFEEKRAVFLTQEGQQLLWNAEDLPEHLEEGETYYAFFRTSAEDTPSATPETSQEAPTQKLSKEEREQRLLAKSILEEILQGGETPSNNAP